jgi:hypothetical protein
LSYSCQLRPAVSEAATPPLNPSVCPSHGIPLTGQCISLERAFSADRARLVSGRPPTSSSLPAIASSTRTSPQKGHARGGRRPADCAGRGPGAVGSQTLRGEEAISPQLSPPPASGLIAQPGAGRFRILFRVLAFIASYRPRNGKKCGCPFLDPRKETPPARHRK